MLNDQNVNEELELFLKNELHKYPYIDKYKDRGIVVCAGGHRYGRCAYVLIKRLKELGCTLPIQVWHLGEQEYHITWASILNNIDGVELIDARQIIKQHSNESWLYKHDRLGGWELKSYAIMHCPFKEVLYLDADNLPIHNPESLFDSQEYLQYGTILWPDYGRLGPERYIWIAMGLPYENEPEVESGQVVLNKETAWQALVLSHWMQHNSDYFYQIIHGDKEVFHMAWKKTQTPYIMPQNLIGMASAMVQHDFQGRQMFYHNNMCKWNRENARNPYEDIGLGLASQYDSLMSPKQYYGTYQYIRVGFDIRNIELGPKSRILAGSAAMESSWKVYKDVLYLFNDGGNVTVDLHKIHKNNTFIGRWKNHEQMPIILKPITTPDCSDNNDFNNSDIYIKMISDIINTNTKANQIVLIDPSDDVFKNIRDFVVQDIDIMRATNQEIRESQFNGVVINIDIDQTICFDTINTILNRQSQLSYICLYGNNKHNFDLLHIILQHAEQYPYVINIGKCQDTNIMIALKQHKNYINNKNTLLQYII